MIGAYYLKQDGNHALHEAIMQSVSTKTKAVVVCHCGRIKTSKTRPQKTPSAKKQDNLTTSPHFLGVAKRQKRCLHQ